MRFIISGTIRSWRVTGVYFKSKHIFIGRMSDKEKTVLGWVIYE